MRYNGSWLGVIWMFLKPFGIFLVLNIVFSNFFFKDSGEQYGVRLLVGLVLWLFFAEATFNGMNSLLSKQHILKKVFFPKWMIILSSTVESLLAFLFKLSVLFVFLLFYYQIYPGPLQLVFFLLYIVLLYGISLIFCFIAAPIYVWIRDLNQIWEVLLQVIFYATPVIYPLNILPEHYQRVLYFNPLTLIIEHSRMVLVENKIPPYNNLVIYLSVFCIAFLISLWSMKKLSRNLVENM
jgi:ABC-type polysaccharide/polyol phosphate export permease